jgi:hypothetical protein
MATVYSSRHSKPLGAGRHAFGGGGLNMGVDALFGETELITVFEDYNMQFADVAPGPGAPHGAWDTVAIGGVGPRVSVNDPAVSTIFHSAILLNCGATGDGGINGRLENATTGLQDTMWFPGNVPAANADHTVLTFSCRVGLNTDDAGGVFDGKAFFGFAIVGDTDIMDPATGAIATVAGAVDGPVVGIHFNADPAVTPNISLIAQRTFGTAPTEGVNFTTMVDGATNTWNQGLTAGVFRFFDVGFRMWVKNSDDANDNGQIRGYWRQVPEIGGSFETANRVAPGLRESKASDSGAVKVEEWSEHDVVLENQTPHDAARLVPAIEVLNGPAAPGNEADFLLDWWAMGISRFSQRGA